MWLSVYHEDHIKTDLCLPFPNSVPSIEGKLKLESTVGLVAGEIVLFVTRLVESFQWGLRHPGIVKDQLPG